MVYHFLLVPKVTAQTVLSGKIYGAKQQPLSFVTVSISAKITGSIIAYAISDKVGSFHLEFRNPTDSLYIQISHIGYYKKELRIANKTSRDNYFLEENPQKLEDITVNSPPIYEHKDTLNYNVSAFTTSKDRVIADIIKKLPGVEIKNGGKIYYNGQEIQRYLVEGLNLMENQYDILNENLPVEAVRKVQIIEHDQPIRLLDSLKFSNKPSLNLKLKKYLTTGMGKIAVGASPILWDIDLTPIVFKKSLQMLNSFQSNNLGVDLNNRIPNENKDSYGAGMITIEGLTTPDFEKNRWLDNHGNFFSTNILKKLNSNIELRGSLSILNNFEVQTGSTKTVFNLPNQSVELLETINNHYNKNMLQAAFRLERNDKKLYWKDNFRINNQWNNDLGSLQNGSNNYASNQTSNIQQRNHANYFNLSNDFITIIPLKKHLIEINSSIKYYNLPQSLTVYPGQFDSLINGGKTYAATKQNLEIHAFHSSNTASWTKKIGALTLSPTAGLEADLQRMTSQLFNPLENLVLNKQELSNNAQFSKWTGFGSINGQVKKEKWRLAFQLPIKYQSIKLEDKIRLDNKMRTKVVFDPGLYLVFNLDQLSSFTYNANLSHQFGNLSRLYTGYLLTNYRNIQRATNIIPFTVSLRNGIRWDFKDPLHQLFLSVGYDFISNKNNITYKTQIDVNGSTKILAIIKDNLTTQHEIDFSANKYILPIKSTIKATARYGYTLSNMQLNGILADVLNKNLNLGITLDIMLTKYLNVTYDNNFLLLKSQIGGTKAASVELQEHHLTYNIFASDHHMIAVKGDYYANNYNSNKNQFFLDASYRYSFGKKKKYDLSFLINNILNARQYQSLQNQGYMTVTHIYQIRERQVVVQLSFNF